MISMDINAITRVRDELPGDWDEIDRIHQTAFGGSGEAHLVRQLRDGGFIRCALVAELSDEPADSTRLIGHIVLSEVSIVDADQRRAALALAPLAIVPAFQRRGIGTRLVRDALARCGRSGHCAVLVLGEPRYYERFNFSTTLASGLTSPYDGPYFMAIEIGPGGASILRGRVEYSPPFAALA